MMPTILTFDNYEDALNCAQSQVNSFTNSLPGTQILKQDLLDDGETVNNVDDTPLLNYAIYIPLANGDKQHVTIQILKTYTELN